MLDRDRPLGADLLTAVTADTAAVVVDRGLLLVSIAPVKRLGLNRTGLHALPAAHAPSRIQDGSLGDQIVYDR